MKKENQRNRELDKYDVYVATRLINGDIVDGDFREFDGKNMLCFCKPKRCHGDTLVKLYYMVHEQRLEWANEVLTLHGGMEQPKSPT